MAMHDGDRDDEGTHEANAIEAVIERRLSRRSLLRGASIAAGASSVALIAACTPTAGSRWTYAPLATGGAAATTATSPTPAPTDTATATAAPVPTAAASATPGAASPSSQPAKTVTVDEISRHPSELPASADYALYADGRYQRLTTRHGPMNHEVHFTTREVVAQVVPGTTMDYWTFDGHVPGPMVRGRVGDTVDFFLKNDAGDSMPHDVDFHAVTGPGGGSVSLDTLPGHESELKVKLLNPGIFVYHCAFPDIPTHISHGMYGLVVVEPAGGLPTVDHEYYVMQSEFYTTKGAQLGYAQLNDAGHLAYSLENGNEERPTFVVFNGRPEAIAGDRSLGTFDRTIKTGQTVRMFVGNIGPNLLSSFHVIGECFDTVYVEGSFALENHTVQTTLIPAGGAVGVEFQVQVPGNYLLVDHAIFRTHKGAVGTLAVTGPAAPDIYDPIKFDKIR
jgi:nitrite reductase (NO-forming)